MEDAACVTQPQNHVNERSGLRLGSRVSFCMEGIDGFISPFMFNRRERSEQISKMGMLANVDSVLTLN
jgi:hypothetical protein